jgi:hypothetical protein
MNKISFIITSPYYDSGIKSIGSKAIYSFNKNTIIEKQYKAIKTSCKNIEHEIIMINSIDHHKTCKFLDKKKLNIQYNYLNINNINHAGCFLKGLELAKYDTVFSIDCGLIVSADAISDTIKNHNNCDISIGCVRGRHKQNTDLEIGCVMADNRHVNNIFFGLENKYIGMICINLQTKDFILNNFRIDQDKNKFMFELINLCISKNLICKKTDLKSKDTHLIFNKKSLQQYMD